MNVKALEKIEKGFIKLDWKQYLKIDIFPIKELLKIAQSIDSFKSNRRVKEIILFRYKNLKNIYVTIHKLEFLDLLEKIKNRLLAVEMYEECVSIQKTIDKVKTYKSYK